MTTATITSFERVFWRPSAPAAPPLRVAPGLRSQNRLAATVLAAICAFALTLTAAPHATSVSLLGSETGVAAQTDPAQGLVGAEAAGSPVLVGGNGVYGYDGVSGCCVAPTSATDDLAAAACRGNSFVPGTEVLMADGSTKPIEDVEIGDLVWASDPESGEAGPRRVIDTIVGDGEKHLVGIRVAGDALTATDGHPFWVDGQGRWVDAGDLESGDRLLLSDGTLVAVSGVVDRIAAMRVHNLTIEGMHTYHVEIGGGHVLVHNSGCLSPNQMNQAIRRGQAPRGVTRIDTPKVTGEQLHATFEGGAALNVDGTWKHGFVDLTRSQRNWLIENGWDL